jgi:hypothetical protein
VKPKKNSDQRKSQIRKESREFKEADKGRRPTTNRKTSSIVATRPKKKALGKRKPSHSSTKGLSRWPTKLQRAGKLGTRN